jgi:hypothetical protein
MAALQRVQMRCAPPADGGDAPVKTVELVAEPSSALPADIDQADGKSAAAVKREHIGWAREPPSAEAKAAAAAAAAAATEEVAGDGSSKSALVDDVFYAVIRRPNKSYEELHTAVADRLFKNVSVRASLLLSSGDGTCPECPAPVPPFALWCGLQIERAIACSNRVPKPANKVKNAKKARKNKGKRKDDDDDDGEDAVADDESVPDPGAGLGGVRLPVLPSSLYDSRRVDHTLHSALKPAAAGWWRGTRHVRVRKGAARGGTLRARPLWNYFARLPKHSKFVAHPKAFQWFSQIITR